MAKNDGGMDYSEFCLKNFLKDREAPRQYYQQLPYDEVPNDQVTHIPRVTAVLPDEVDNVPYRRPPMVNAEEIGYPDMPGVPAEQPTRRDVDYEPPKHGKRGRKRRKKGGYRKRGIAIVILTIVICASITLLIADAVSGGYILDEIQAVFAGDNVTDRYYAVSTGSFSDTQTAKVFATQVSLIGGAGYVINDGTYKVIAEVYGVKKDADIVAARLSTDGFEASVYEIAVRKISYKHFPQTVRNNTKQVLSYADMVYNSLYGISCNLASNKIDKSGAKAELKTLLSSVRALLVDYESNVDNSIDDDNVVKVRVQIAAIVAAVENLVEDDSKKEELLSNIRYTNTMTLNTHRALCNEFVAKDNQ